jgi:hypothetical protein
MENNTIRDLTRIIAKLNDTLSKLIEEIIKLQEGI